MSVSEQFIVCERFLKSRVNLLSRGSQFYEMIGAAEYRNEIFLMEY